MAKRNMFLGFDPIHGPTEGFDIEEKRRKKRKDLNKDALPESIGGVVLKGLKERGILGALKEAGTSLATSGKGVGKGVGKVGKLAFLGTEGFKTQPDSERSSKFGLRPRDAEKGLITPGEALEPRRIGEGEFIIGGGNGVNTNIPGVVGAKQVDPAFIDTEQRLGATSETGLKTPFMGDTSSTKPIELSETQRQARKSLGVGSATDFESIDDQIEFLQNKKNRTGSHLQKQEIQDNIDRLEMGREAEARRSGALEIAQTQTKGAVAAAVAGNQAALAELRNDFAIAGIEAKGKMVGDITRNIVGNENLTPTQMIKSLRDVFAEIGSDDVADTGRTVGAASPEDINQDGQVSDAELEFNKISTVIKTQKNRLTPAQLARLNTRLAELKPEVTGA